MSTGSRVLSVVAALGALSLSGCSADPDPALVADLEQLEMPLRLPELRRSGLSNLHVDGGRAIADVTAFPGTSFWQAAAPGPVRVLCRALRWSYLHDSHCTAVGDDAIVADFEEMTTVAIVRDETVLVLRGLVTEADASLTDDALAALREAPVVSAEELALEAGS